MNKYLSLIPIILLAISVGHLSGRITSSIEQSNGPKTITFTPKTSMSQPIITLKSLIGNTLTGQVNLKNIQLVVDNEVVNLNEKLEFEIDLKKIRNRKYIVVPRGAKYVGSINGTKAHKIESSSAKKIAPENRIYFETLKKAKLHGYKE